MRVVAFRTTVLAVAVIAVVRIYTPEPRTGFGWEWVEDLALYEVTTDACRRATELECRLSTRDRAAIEYEALS